MLALVASPYFMALGGIVTLDMGLTLWTTLTTCAFLLAEQAHVTPSQDGVQSSRVHRRWMLVGWAAMALAVMSKGLIGIVFALGDRACVEERSARARVPAASARTSLERVHRRLLQRLRIEASHVRAAGFPDARARPRKVRRRSRHASPRPLRRARRADRPFHG